MRLIDGEELERLFNEQIEQGATDAFAAFDDALQDTPTVDAEVVVRCKDCYQSVVIGNVLHCTYWRKNTDENGYCHEGG
jgi:hypothetical protein